jgi:hypothetical protein
MGRKAILHKEQSTLESNIVVGNSGVMGGSSDILTDRRFAVHIVVRRLKITFRRVNKSPLCNLKFHHFYLLYKILRIKPGIIVQLH